MSLMGSHILRASCVPEDRVGRQGSARQFTKELTQRQKDIVQLFGEGRPIKQIAGVLNLSEKTVEFHKHHIMDLIHPEE